MAIATVWSFMLRELIKISEKKEKAIAIIKKALIEGKIIVLPTDTVYGLVCDARNQEAVRRIFEIKKRLFDKPIGVFVKDIEMAKKVAQIDEEQEKLLKQNWPGKTTFILKKKIRKVRPRGISLSSFTGTKKSIGIRIPDYELIRFLFEKIDFPLAQTSANISGQPATTKIKQVLKQLDTQKSRPDLVVDAGNLPESKPSTVIDLTGREPKVLRK